MIDDYFIPIDGLDVEALVEDWRWLIGNKDVVLAAVAAVGNLFLKGESGRIYLLEIEDGTCEGVAASIEDFHQKLGDRHNRRAWLQGFLVRDLRERGVALAPGQCYGRKLPSHLEGAEGGEDYEPIDLRIHVSILGQLHRQSRADSSEA